MGAIVSKPIPQLTERQLEHFWSKVQKSNCWEWTGSTKNGYGLLRVNGSDYYAHRISYAITNEDPGKFCVCHTCDNPKCVNPSHLWLGTHLDNMGDMVAKRRHSHGEKTPQAKLTKEQVKEILESKETHQILSDRYGVSRRHIGDIRTGVCWNHLEGPRRVFSARGNSQTGVRGVSPYGNRFHAEFMSRSQRYRLGKFDTIKEAKQAIITKRKDLKLESQ